MNRDKSERHAQSDADDSQSLSKEVQSLRRQRQAKYLRQQLRILRASRLTGQDPLYWPLRKVD